MKERERPQRTVYIPARQLLDGFLTHNLDFDPQRFPFEDVRSKLIPYE